MRVKINPIRPSGHVGSCDCDPDMNDRSDFGKVEALMKMMGGHDFDRADGPTGFYDLQSNVIKKTISICL